MIVVCCQVEFFATGRSLAQRRHTDCGVSECGLEISKMRRFRPTKDVQPRGKKIKAIICNNVLPRFITKLTQHAKERNAN